MESYSPSLVVLTIISALLLKNIAQAIYNLLHHPLRHFPGPKWATASRFDKCWQEVFRQRNWIDVLHSLHEQYGDVIRVGPNDLHFSAPAA